MKLLPYFFLLASTLTVVGSIKNILLIVSDDLKADAINCYGNKTASTPNIDRLASEGTLFKMLIVKVQYVLHRGQVSCGVDILEKPDHLGGTFSKLWIFKYKSG